MIYFKAAILFLICSLLGEYGVCESFLHANENSGDELRLSRIIRASNIEKLKIKTEELRKLEAKKDQCDIQLRYEMLPSSCFEVIRTEKKMGLLSPQKFQETFVWLTENCIDRASQLKEVVKEVDNNKEQRISVLPEKCLEIVNRKIGDQFYRDITMHPVSLFKQRF